MGQNRGDYPTRREILKATAASTAATLGGCNQLESGAKNTATATPTDSSTRTPTSTETEEPTPTETETPTEPDWEQLLEQNVQNRRDMWRQMPQENDYMFTRIEPQAVQRSIAEDRGLTHEIRAHKEFPYASDQITEDDITGLIYPFPNNDGRVIGAQYNDIDGETALEAMENAHETVGHYRNLPILDTGSFIKTFSPEEELYLRTENREDMKLAIDTLEEQHPSVDEPAASGHQEFSWYNSQPFQNNIILESMNKAYLPTSQFGGEGADDELREDNVEDLMDVLIYNPEAGENGEGGLQEVLFLYDGNEWYEDDRVDGTITYQLDYVHEE